MPGISGAKLERSRNPALRGIGMCPKGGGGVGFPSASDLRLEKEGRFARIARPGACMQSRITEIRTMPTLGSDA